MRMSDSLYLEAMREKGKADAAELQGRAASMDGTSLYAEGGKIPDFQAARAAQNMLHRHAGMQDGFVCRSSAGRVVRLIQNYDSNTYPQEPEELPAQWAFVWSKDPRDALPFVALSTSPYNIGDCCTYDGHIWRSGQDNNTWAPGTLNIKWDDLGSVENAMDEM